MWTGNLGLRKRILALGWWMVLSVSYARAQTATQMYAEGVEAYQQGNAVIAKQRLQLALEMDPGFRPATALLARIAADQRSGVPAGLSSASLERTIVPVEFKDATLDSALEFLRQRADEVSAGKLKLNFVVNLPPELAKKRVTLQMDRVPIIQILKYIGDLAGVNFEVQRYAIVVTPAGGNPAPSAKPNN